METNLNFCFMKWYILLNLCSIFCGGKAPSLFKYKFHLSSHLSYSMSGERFSRMIMDWMPLTFLSVHINYRSYLFWEKYRTGNRAFIYLFQINIPDFSCRHLVGVICILNHMWITPSFRKSHTSSTLLIKYNEIPLIHKQPNKLWLTASVKNIANMGLQKKTTADLMPLSSPRYINNTSLITIKNTLLPTSTVLTPVAKQTKKTDFIACQKIKKCETCPKTFSTLSKCNWNTENTCWCICQGIRPEKSVLLQNFTFENSW